MKQKENRPSLLDGLVQQLSNHADMVARGVKSESALRATFGEDEGNDILRIIDEATDDTSFFDLDKNKN